MNIVFMGTPTFAVPALRALAANEEGRFSVKLVFTRPDAASGRGKALLPSPVRRCAEELALPVLTPQNFYAYARPSEDGRDGRNGRNGRANRGGRAKDESLGGLPVAAHDSEGVPLFNSHGGRVVDAELLARVAAAEPDVIVVAAYGMILPRQMLDLPRHGCVNIHASLLPRWRGAAPIQRAILAGDEQTGVCVMRMEEGLDTGAVCGVATTPAVGKNARELTDELAELGARLLADALPRIVDGTAEWIAQSEDGITYANKVEKYELALDPTDTARVNAQRVLASTPQTPARCVICGRPVTVLACRAAAGVDGGAAGADSGAAGAGAAGAGAAGAGAAAGAAGADSGTAGAGAASFIRKQLLLATADGDLEIISLKPDGKKEMAAAAFAAGVKELQKGTRAGGTSAASGAFGAFGASAASGASGAPGASATWQALDRNSA
jgi:methionyl-tRNA formyltransferase